MYSFEIKKLNKELNFTCPEKLLLIHDKICAKYLLPIESSMYLYWVGTN